MACDRAACWTNVAKRTACHQNWLCTLHTHPLICGTLFLVPQNCYLLLSANDYVLTVFFFPDPFADAIKGSDDDVQDGLVHIRIQQRNGRKTLTTVQGLSSEYDLKKIVRACKKVRIGYFIICTH